MHVVSSRSRAVPFALLVAASLAWVSCGEGDPDVPDDEPGPTPSRDGGQRGDGGVTRPDGGMCLPTTCAVQMKNCGEIADGCGNTLPCGSCSGAETCGGGGVANVCGASSKIEHVFVVMLENKGDMDVYGSSNAPYINELMSQYAYATRFDDVLPKEESEPHYIWLEAGTNAFPDHTFTTNDDASAQNSTASTKHLSSVLTSKGISWMSYQEDIAEGDCPISSSPRFSLGNYAAKHNPFIFFRDVSGSPPDAKNAFCAAHHRPYSRLAGDLEAKKVASYVLITPNQCHDMHGAVKCPLQATDAQRVKAGDKWLKEEMPRLIAFAAANKGLILITWDEPQGETGYQPFIVVGSGLKAPGYQSAVTYDLSSVLKSLQIIFRVSPAEGTPFLGHAEDPLVNDLADFFLPGAYP